jgi:hypothetical protein
MFIYGIAAYLLIGLTVYVDGVFSAWSWSLRWRWLEKTALFLAWPLYFLFASANTILAFWLAKGERGPRRDQ